MPRPTCPCIPVAHLGDFLHGRRLCVLPSASRSAWRCTLLSACSHDSLPTVDVEDSVQYVLDLVYTAPGSSARSLSQSIRVLCLPYLTAVRPTHKTSFKVFGDRPAPMMQNIICSPSLRCQWTLTHDRQDWVHLLHHHAGYSARRAAPRPRSAAAACSSAPRPAERARSMLRVYKEEDFRFVSATSSCLDHKTLIIACGLRR